MLCYMSEPQEGTAQNGRMPPPRRDDHGGRRELGPGVVSVRTASAALAARMYVDRRRQI